MSLGIQGMTLPILKNEDVCAGDVLICFSAVMRGEDKQDGSGYSHVAIFVDDDKVLESNSAGVKFTSISMLLDEYDHIAVMRKPELWPPHRIALLRNFANENIGKKFNPIGMRKYPDRKTAYQESAMERVYGYFEGTRPEVKTERKVYFCSELVTAAFIHVGIIGKSATELFTPETFSPEDIGRDKAFGFFLGYLIPYPEYQVPEADYFRSSL